MTDWKAVKIGTYLALEHEKRSMEEEMRSNPSFLRVKNEIKKLEDRLEMQVSRYKGELINYDTQMRSVQDELVEGWDSADKSFKCDAGSAAIRTTRALKIDDKEMLISILQHIGKLTQCIKSWDLTYLRKLADAGLFDVADGELNIVHYDEKTNVVISVIKGGDSGNERW